MFPDLLFIEYRATDFLPEVKRLFDDMSDMHHITVDTFEGDVALIDTENKAFVSPGNSLGFMDGGIDYTYSRHMFPGCEYALRQKIIKLGKRTDLGRPYLPVGSAITLEGEKTSILIASPTMFLPHNVSGTNNAYHAFTAVLGAYDKFTRQTEGVYHTIVCPALCCGYGKMDPKESARQIYRAYTDWYFGARNTPDMSDVTASHYYVTSSKDHEQPDNFDNREIKAIHPALL